MSQSAVRYSASKLTFSLLLPGQPEIFNDFILNPEN